MLVYQRVGVFLIPKTSEIQTMQLVADSTLFFFVNKTHQRLHAMSLASAEVCFGMGSKFYSHAA
jgi:hypothetical protein